ncbi:hypothetical protein ACQSSU_20420 [Micromonospora echinospora]
MAETSPAPTTTWHHPHYISEESGVFGTTYRFRPFTGDEPKPEIPGDVRDRLRRDWDAYNCAQQEVWAADTVWRAARYCRDVTAGLRAAVPAAQAYLRAKQAVAAAYCALDDAPDGKWRATLLRLVDARSAALGAAEAFDRAIGPAVIRSVKEPERVLEETPGIEELAHQAGIDTTGWHIGYSDDYARSGWLRFPSREALEAEFRQQDERIKEVRRLAGDPE